MEHLNRFLDFFKKKVKRIDNEEKLFIQLNNVEISAFYENHKPIKIDQSTLDDIQNFISQNDSIKYLSKIEYLENGCIIIQHEKSGAKRKENQEAWISIKLFDDEWFIVNIISGKKASHWVFKCDTIDGVKQVLLGYPEFNHKNGPYSLHWQL